MRERMDYRLDLSALAEARGVSKPAAVGLRPPSKDDETKLAELILDAYKGTVDYEGEGPQESLAEVQSWFGGEACPAMPECSVVAWSEGEPVAACLVGWWTAKKAPLIQYVFTASPSKRRGFGRLVLTEALRLLADSGHREVLAVVTKGNKASVALIEKAGFVLGPTSLLRA